MSMRYGFKKRNQMFTFKKGPEIQKFSLDSVYSKAKKKNQFTKLFLRSVAFDNFYQRRPILS